MIFVALGSSIGNAKEAFVTAQHFLENHEVEIIKKSKIMVNPPQGGVAKNEFSNAVWQIQWPETTWERINWVLLPQKRRQYLKAKNLLNLLQNCEKHLGRVRKKKWADRTLDLDILIFENLICTSKRLTIPHPEISKRDFVLLPWQEIVDEAFTIPKFGLLPSLIKDLKP